METKKWHKIANSIDQIHFAENGLTSVEVDGKTVTIAHHQNKVFACAQKCPHAGGFLADGYIDTKGNIVCPVHRYKYSLANGRNVSGEGYFLARFDVEIREEGVFICTDPSL